ncbi:MAG: 2-hydroxyacid dehydrogenase [Candidatus Methylacidiphilales bacterium]|nr:2-hydroxyacid dehydrogenase [Candidatus Methylacidiphilales bacterium]
MKVAVFDTHKYERATLVGQNEATGHELVFFEEKLKASTALLASGCQAVTAFVNDCLNRETLTRLKELGVRIIAMRCAGYNNVDLAAAAELGLPVVRVPEYSPYAVAEHATALLLALNRKITRASNRVHDNNYSLDGLVGFDIHGKTVGLLGTGKIGLCFARIMKGFGARILAYDAFPRQQFADEIGFEYAPLDAMLREADIISLHVPLLPDTLHIINEEAVEKMKRGVFIINTSRGPLVDARALIKGLKTGHIGGAGLDVYEEEEHLFFRDLSDQILQDDVLARLLSFNNVLITAHQAFLTIDALKNIASTTWGNLAAFEKGEPLVNEIKEAKK